MVTLSLVLSALVCIGIILFVGLFIANEYFKTKDFIQSNLCTVNNVTLMGKLVCYFILLNMSCSHTKSVALPDRVKHTQRFGIILYL